MPEQKICDGCLHIIHPMEDYVYDPGANGAPTHATCYEERRFPPPLPTETEDPKKKKK